MRIVDGVADLLEEAKALVHGQPVLVAIGSDGHPLDALHHEIGLPRLARAAIKESRDVLVLEGGEDLPLLLEPPPNLAAAGFAPDDLQGDLLPKSAIHTGGQIDIAHSTAPKLVEDAVGAEVLPGFGWPGLLRFRGDELRESYRRRIQQWRRRGIARRSEERRVGKG